ncbi:MAG: uroporphyrinogen-III synthase [Micavibrio sp.]
MTCIILITRPAEDATETAAAVTALGYRALCAPVLAIDDTDAALPDPALYQGLIFSSANGVRSFMRRQPLAAYFTLPAFVVGDHTEKAAREAGFPVIHNAKGTMNDLVALVQNRVTAPARLLHLRGADVREDPAMLTTLPIDGITLYRAAPVTSLDPDVLAALRVGAVEAVLFYSARSAESFVSALKNDWPAADLRTTKALCLADSVVESLHRFNWAAVHVSLTPDQVGMLRLLKSLKTMPVNSTPQNDANALNDAEKIIERFGGIRPMATKMNVPVTTVQGWKKRNVIPGNRRNDVLAAARMHQVDLSDVIANENNFDASLRQAGQEQVVNPASARIHEQAVAAAKRTEAMEAGSVTHEAMMSEIKNVQTRAVRRSVAAASAVVLLFAVVAGLLIAVGKQQNEARIASLESTVEEIADRPAVGTVENAMTDISRKFGALREKTEQLQNTVADLKGQADMLLDPENSSLVDRLMTLEQKIQTLTGGDTDLSLVLQRVQDMQTSLQGQQQLQATMGDLQGLVGKLQGRMDEMDTALAEEQQSDSALGQALEGVSPEELKAAAMLIGLSQFRDSMNRSGPFADDLALLQTMLGEKDPALNAEITRLAPYAEKGVLSPKGLSNELKGLAGDIVVSSISGEDVSIQDKALARFQDVLTIQKDGQPVMGTDTQATVARAQQMLDAGDVDAAVLELQTLQGPARQTAQPLIDQAEITAMAQKVQGMLTTNIMSQIKSRRGGSAPYTATPIPQGGIMGPSFIPPANRQMNIPSQP